MGNTVNTCFCTMPKSTNRDEKVPTQILPMTFEEHIKEVLASAVKWQPEFGNIPYIKRLTLGDTYVVGEQLGSGGFASVYAATEKSTSQRVALKMIKKDEVVFWTRTVVDDQSVPKGEPYEITALRKLSQVEGVIGLRAVYVINDCESNIINYVLVLETPSLPVMNLFDYAKQDKLPKEEIDAKDIIRQIVEIITRVHNAGVYHQDLKHENVLIEPNTGRVHLCDFGMSVPVYKEPFEQFSGTTIIKPFEMISHGMYHAESATVWSIGVLAYRLLAFRPPFWTDAEIKVTRPRIPEHFSSDLRNFISQCLVRDPALRPTLPQLARHHWLMSETRI